MEYLQQALKQADATHINAMNSLMIQFAKQIETLRKQRGLKKKDLAKKIGVSPAYITKVMQGEANYTVETLAKFAHALEAEISLNLCDKTALKRIDEQYLFGVMAQHKQRPRFKAFNDAEFVQTEPCHYAKGEIDVAASA